MKADSRFSRNPQVIANQQKIPMVESKFSASCR